MPACVLGVDGCRGGWIACRLNAETASAAFLVYATFAEMLTAEADASVIAVDIPIGLRDDWSARGCDREAKAILGARRSSIFPAPPRALLACLSYQEANQRSFEDFDRGLSQRTFHLFPKIREVDAFLRSTSSRRVFETHPELAFRQLHGADLLHGKKTVEGYEERRMILRQKRIKLPPASEWRAALHLQREKLQRDDLADAAVAALVALRIAQGAAGSLPVDPEVDRSQIPMQIFC